VEADVDEDVEVEAEGDRRVVMFSSSSLRSEERWMLMMASSRSAEDLIPHFVYIYLFI